jgi:hypothetical protein
MDKQLFLSEGSDWLFSLSKLVGKKVIDVVGYPSDPFGDAPLFKIVEIVFEDKTTISVEGEHDVPYLPADNEVNNMDEQTLQGFSDSSFI